MYFIDFKFYWFSQLPIIEIFFWIKPKDMKKNFLKSHDYYGYPQKIR